MNRIIERLRHDRVTQVLLGALALFAAFIAWQLARVDNAQPGANAVATASAGGVSVGEAIQSLENAPVSRPQLALQRWKTSRGTRVYFVPAPELPMLDVRVVFDGGGARDGGLAGLARFTSAMIGEGTATRSADAINAGFENVGAQFSASSYRDMAVVELRSLTQPELLAPALTLFSDVIARPSFPRDDLERTRNQMLVGLARAEEDPGTIASRAFMTALYLVHPYAAPPEGTVDTVKAIRVEDLRAFHQRYYVARNAIIAITGAVDRTRAEDIAEQVSAALPEGSPAPPLPSPPVAKGGHFHVKYDSQQTHILIGLPSLARHDPDEAALVLANEVLGGSGLNSLLGEEVRNKRGLAYSVGSGFQAMRADGPFLVSLQTRNDAAGEALGVALDTLKRYAQQGPAPAQLEDARRQLVGNYPMQFAGNGAIVGTLGMMAFYDLPDDYLARRLASFEQLDVAAVRKAFAAHVPMNALMIVTLGPEKPVPRATGASAAPAAAAQPASTTAGAPP